MNGGEFTASLAEENRVALERLAQLSAAGEPPPDLSVERLLRIALKNELEASELAAIWMSTTSELDVKLAFARQTGDEAKHYRLIADRLKVLGVDADRIDPRQGGYSPLFEYLRALQSTAARVAAGQFTREAIALVRNQCFIDFWELLVIWKRQRFIGMLFSLTRSSITNSAGDCLRFTLPPKTSSRLRVKQARRTLELAEEIQEMARLKAGISRAPGC